MLNRTIAQIRKLQVAVVLAAGVAVVTAPADAAQSTAATPTSVEYFGASPNLYIVIGGVQYVGQLTAPGCGGSAQSVETLKLWASLAQSAFLSGKKISIWYDTGGACGTNRYIASVILQS